MINLLPEPARRSLRTTYYARLAAVVVLLASCVVLAGAALLAPSYFLARADASALQNYLANSAQTFATAQGALDTATLSGLSEQVSLMNSYPRPPRVAAALSAITENVPAGVSVTKITLAPGASGSDAISISGIAGTRDELLALATALQSSSAFSGVSVPLSQLAGEANIVFSLSFSLVSPHP